MQVSFVIPLYNQLALTQACLASLRATLPRGLTHEIILVDDGSTDGTRAWLATLRDANVRVVLNEKNLGYAAANNRGAALARGDSLVLLNNDLVLTRDWLDAMLSVQHCLGPKAGVIGNVQLNLGTGEVDHVGIFIDSKAKPEHDRHRPLFRLNFLPPVRRVPAVTGACALLDRALWNQLGGFDEAFVNGGEDVDLCFRARAAGRVNAVALRSVIGHHVSASRGRQLRDERNSRRLATKWRRELESLAWHQWSWHYLAREWHGPRDPAGCATAFAVLLFALRFRRQPPPIVVGGMHAAMDREFARWQSLLGD